MLSVSKPLQLSIVAALACVATLGTIALPFAPTRWNLLWSLGVPILVGLAFAWRTWRNENVLLHVAMRIAWICALILWSAAVVFVTLILYGT